MKHRFECVEAVVFQKCSVYINVWPYDNSVSVLVSLQMGRGTNQSAERKVKLQSSVLYIIQTFNKPQQGSSSYPKHTHTICLY